MTSPGLWTIELANGEPGIFWSPWETVRDSNGEWEGREG